MESAKERDTFVYLAKLSEQAERYEGKESSSYGFYESYRWTQGFTYVSR